MSTQPKAQADRSWVSPHRRAARRWLAQLVPSAQEARDLTALATGMSGLAMRHQAIALELAAQASSVGGQRSFLVRAQTLEGQTHVLSQVRAQYPQVQVHTLTAEDDPLFLKTQEAVSCVELRLGAPSYLPLRIWQRQALDEEGTDPLLNVLAALNTLPVNHRAVVQLVLTPASDQWSRRAQRFAQASPLEEERFQRQLLTRARPRTTNLIEHGMFLEGLGLALLVVLLFSWLWVPLQHLIPVWVWQAVSALIQGQTTALAPWQWVQLGLGMVVLLAALVVIGLLGATVRKGLEGGWRPTRIYDPELVRQKTERVAYRATLRLYVLGPQSHKQATPTDTAVHTLARRDRLAAAWTSVRLGLRRSWWQALPRHFRHLLPQGTQWMQARWLLLQRRHQATNARRLVLARLVTAYRAYHLASGNFFVPRRVPRWRAQYRLAPQAPVRLVRTRWWHPDYLTPEEVASLYHLIQADLRHLSFVERTRARTLPVPWVLATADDQAIGINEHAGVRTPVRFPEGGLHYNTLALAGTGKGKSSLFAHLARVLLADPLRRGMVLVDPHGDLSLVFLGCIPQARRDEVVYLNLADTANPPGLNFLDMSSGQDRDKVVDMLLSIFKGFWKDNWGSRIENTMQYALLTLCEVNRARCRADRHRGPRRQCTILSVVPLLQQPHYRKALLREFRDADIGAWWKGYYERQEEDEQKEIAASVLTKISKFRASKVVRRIVGQPVSSLSVAEIVTQGRLLIVNTASGIVGEDTSTLCGSMLLGWLHACIAEQAERPSVTRTSIYVFLDEMQKFPSVNLNAMLAELRKYGGHFALATQSFEYLDALDKTLRATLAANTDQLFAFDMSAPDAKAMADEIGDGIGMEDILSLDNYECYAKLTLEGTRLPAFSLRLLPPPAGDPKLVQALVEKSARIYGCPAREVDRQVRWQEKAGTKRTPGGGPTAPPTDDDDGLSPNFERTVEEDSFEPLDQEPEEEEYP